MRAGPLSNRKVIALLNRSFVPVYISNEDYRSGGSAAPADKAERNRIFRESLKARLSTGTVHVYILTPDGHPIDSLHVANAAKVERLLDLLQRTVDKLKVPPGKPVVKPIAKSAPPKTYPDTLVLHLTARYLRRQGHAYVPLQAQAHLGESRNAGWGASPSENWIVLKRAEWLTCLPSAGVRVGTTWKIGRKTAAKLLTYFYPPSENNDVQTNRIDDISLKATVVSIAGGSAHAQIHGSLKMKHPFYHRDDNQFVEATVIGVLDFDPAKKIRSLRLVTDEATYGRRPFGVTLQSMP